MVSREQIMDEIYQFCTENNIIFDEMKMSIPIFETGLDSLDFAALVARLETSVGIDPFRSASEAFYPETLEAFVSAYVGK